MKMDFLALIILITLRSPLPFQQPYDIEIKKVEELFSKLMKRKCMPQFVWKHKQQVPLSLHDVLQEEVYIPDFYRQTMECRLQVVPDLRWSPPQLYKKQGKENSTFAHHTELLTWNANINFFFTDFDFRNRHHQKGGSALSLKGLCWWKWTTHSFDFNV